MWIVRRTLVHFFQFTYLGDTGDDVAPWVETQREAFKFATKKAANEAAKANTQVGAFGVKVFKLARQRKSRDKIAKRKKRT